MVYMIFKKIHMKSYILNSWNLMMEIWSIISYLMLCMISYTILYLKLKPTTTMTTICGHRRIGSDLLSYVISDIHYCCFMILAPLSAGLHGRLLACTLSSLCMNVNVTSYKNSMLFGVLEDSTRTDLTRPSDASTQ
jgi:hypothetical protein